MKEINPLSPKRETTIFLAVVFLGTWLFWLTVLQAENHGFLLPVSDGLFIRIGGFIPSAVGLILACRFGGKKELYALLRSLINLCRLRENESTDRAWLLQHIWRAGSGFSTRGDAALDHAGLGAGMPLLRLCGLRHPKKAPPQGNCAQADELRPRKLNEPYYKLSEIISNHSGSAVYYGNPLGVDEFAPLINGELLELLESFVVAPDTCREKVTEENILAMTLLHEPYQSPYLPDGYRKRAEAQQRRLYLMHIDHGDEEDHGDHYRTLIQPED